MYQRAAKISDLDVANRRSGERPRVSDPFTLGFRAATGIFASGASGRISSRRIDARYSPAPKKYPKSLSGGGFPRTGFCGKEARCPMWIAMFVDIWQTLMGFYEYVLLGVEG